MVLVVLMVLMVLVILMVLVVLIINFVLKYIWYPDFYLSIYTDYTKSKISSSSSAQNLYSIEQNKRKLLNCYAIMQFLLRCYHSNGLFTVDYSTKGAPPKTFMHGNYLGGQTFKYQFDNLNQII